MKRLKVLKRILKAGNSIPCLLTDLISIRYLTGFTGSHAYLIAAEKKFYFISDSRYEEYAKKTLPAGIEFVLQKGDAGPLIKEIITGTGARSLSVDDYHLDHTAFLTFKKALRGIKLTSIESPVAKMRVTKDDGEAAVMRDAAAITDRCFSHLLKFIRPGITEWDISLEIEMFFKKNGCRKNSFDSIVAAGADSSMPHYETSLTKKVKKGDVVLIDMGCVYEGYNSDFTRTVFLGAADKKIKEIYDIVLEAQTRAINGIKPGATTSRLDRLARGHIERAGYGEMFGHSLGHGVGLEIHEAPTVKDNDIRLKRGMTITIEPGIYLPGTGGVRIEDMVLVTGDGAEVLTKSSRELIVI